MDESSLRVERRSGPSGVVVYANGRPLTGSDPVASMARRLPDPATISPQTLFLVLSPLDGFGLEDWFTRLPATCAVLVVELDPELARLQQRIASWHHHRHVAVAGSWDAAIHAADRLTRSRAPRRLKTIHLTGGSRLHRDRYLRLEDRLRRSIQQYWNNRGTQIRLHRRWIANVIRNVARPGKPVTDLVSRVGDRAILVGAGPSLDTHISLLTQLFPPGEQEIRDRRGGILVSIDTALPALAAAGIQPDFVVTMDSQLANAQDFLPWKWSGTSVIADATTHFSIPRRFPESHRYWFVSRFSEIQLFTDPELSPLLEGIPIIPPFGSVAPAAVHLLSNTLGIAELLLVGIDFWYRLPKTHAEMSTADRWLLRASSRTTHRDGHDRAPARPLRSVQLRDGTRSWGDAVLCDQAELMREIISHATGRVLHLSGPGLELGAQPIGAEQAAHWWTGGQCALSYEHTPGPRSVERRTAALHALLRRLRCAEEQLQRDDGTPIIDGGLDFVLVDLPQWPLMTLSPDWMRLHRLRILRSVRDYRRRVETLLLRGSPQD